MVTIGKTDEGKPICKLLQPEAYFKTYNDAYEALMKYNEHPYDISKEITLDELHDRWAMTYFKDTLPASSRYLKGSWNYCEPLKKMKVREIRARHIKQLIDETPDTTPVVRKNIKTLFKKMLDYAVEYEIVERNYAKDVLLPKNDNKEMVSNRKSHIPYSDEEMQILWKNINLHPLAEIVIFQCYSGWRPSELENLRTADVDLEKGIMIGGMKTDAGKDRVVPIHSKIRFIVEKWYQDAVREGREYLISIENIKGRKATKLTYYRYMFNLVPLLKALNLNKDHLPHDGRVTFVTMAKKYQMDEYAIKHIVGHSIKDITEAVYTKRENEWLQSEIEKIM